MNSIDISAKEKIYTSKEYHQLEELADKKHEFRNGKLKEMSGGSSNHADIIGNVYVGLRAAIKSIGKKYRTFNSELKIYIAAYNQNVYPDTFVIMDKPEYVDNKFSVSNPTLIVEVLSDSTAKYDRGRKFIKYKTLSSFQEYVIIEQDTPIVDVISKKGEEWVIKTYIGLEDTVQLESIGCELAMEDIYENVEDLEHPQGVIDFDNPLVE